LPPLQTLPTAPPAFLWHLYLGEGTSFTHEVFRVGDFAWVLGLAAISNSRDLKINRQTRVP
jgi:hypothetical protein